MHHNPANLCCQFFDLAGKCRRAEVSCGSGKISASGWKTDFQKNSLQIVKRR